MKKKWQVEMELTHFQKSLSKEKSSYWRRHIRTWIEALEWFLDENIREKKENKK